MAHPGLTKLQELKKDTTAREMAILNRMKNSESESTEEAILPATAEEPVTLPEPSAVSNVPMSALPGSKPLYDPSCTQARLIEYKPAPAHSIELIYDSGKEGITGATDKFSVRVFASEINEDDDNISIVLSYDVLIKPPSYTELQVKIDNKEAVKVMMGGTVKHGPDRFLFLLKVK